MTRYQNSTAAAETTRLRDQLVLKIFGEPCLSLIDSIACQSWLTALSNDSRYLSTLYALSDRIKLMTREFDTLPASEQFRDVLAAFKVNGVSLLHTRRSFQTPSEFLTCAQFQDGHRLPAPPALTSRISELFQQGLDRQLSMDNRWFHICSVLEKTDHHSGRNTWGTSRLIPYLRTRSRNSLLAPTSDRISLIFCCSSSGTDLCSSHGPRTASSCSRFLLTDLLSKSVCKVHVHIRRNQNDSCLFSRSNNLRDSREYR